MEPINVDIEQEDRYARLRLIPWWDQEKLKQAVVMVVGAGAIGNEILKNLALLGVGTILIVDMDTIENSNLSRAVLYRETDEGKSKADTAARQVMELNPDIRAIPINGSVITDVGTGFFRHVDLVLGGLDNREARLFINQKCWHTSTPWIDGAIEVFQGFARVFVPPDSACYECTMNETDYKLLNFRKSCSLLSKRDLMEGKVPTTPTTASVIAGLQVQEAVKLLHGDRQLRPLYGQGIVFNGLTHDTYQVTYTRNEACMSHDTWENILEMDWCAHDVSLQEVLTEIKKRLSPKAVLETNVEILLEGFCSCGHVEAYYRPLMTVAENDVYCPYCGKELDLNLTHRFEGYEPFLHKKLTEIGFAPGEILIGREGAQVIYLELTGDISPLIIGAKKEGTTDECKTKATGV